MHQSLLCPECGSLNRSETFDADCQSCGARLGGRAARRKKPSRKFYLLTIGFVCALVLITLIVFVRLRETNARRSAAADFATLIPAATLTAANLDYIYGSNELYADEIYKGKVLEVSGEVARVSKGVFATICVSLKAGEGRVDCYFDEADSRALVLLRPGKIVTIRGSCDGKAAGVVALKDCAIKEKAPPVETL